MRNVLLSLVCAAAAASPVSAWPQFEESEDDDTGADGDVLEGWDYEDDMFDWNDEWVDSDFFSPWNEQYYAEDGEYEAEEDVLTDPESEGVSELDFWEYEETGWDYDPARSEWEDAHEEYRYQFEEGYGFYDEIAEWELDQEDTQVFDGWYEEGGIY